jgi:hypothetical protein
MLWHEYAKQGDYPMPSLSEKEEIDYDISTSSR